MYKEYGCNDSLKGCDYKSSPLFLKNREYSLQRYISLIFSLNIHSFSIVYAVFRDKSAIFAV